jgi:hypothetical protein
VERAACDVLRPVRAEGFLVLRLAEGVLCPEEDLFPEAFFER